MPIRKDYILRLIDEFFKILARILKLKEDKQYSQALEAIDETSQSLLHIDIQEIAENDVAFSQIITGPSSLDQVEILAELLKVKADIYQETHLPFSAINHYQKALHLFEFVQNHSKDYSISRDNKIKEIKINILRMGD
jgi:hypothetical protein